MEKRIVFILCSLSLFLSIGYSIDAAATKSEVLSNGTYTSNESVSTTSSTVKPTTPSPTTTTTTTPPPPITTHSPAPSTPSTAPTSTPKPTPSPTPITTPKPTPSPTTTTLIPPPAPTPAPKPDRSFDLPSFVGGIILALGVLAIGYVIYKFYRARTDPNYRSL